jgi:hypothetical protein
MGRRDLLFQRRLDREHQLLGLGLHDCSRRGPLPCAYAVRLLWRDLAW